MSDPALLDSVVDDLARDGDIDVTSWTDLEGLPDDMAALDAQYSAITEHATTWVCQRAGFEPSPVCLFRPLAEVMDLLAEAFGWTQRLVADEWADLRAGVAATTADLQAVDQMVADALPVVA